jgi:hypothetical protein
MRRRRSWRAVGASAGILASVSVPAHAAGPYAVDDASIGDVGECQVESWVSAASNGDFVATTQPACVVRLGTPVELTAAFHAVRSDGEWAGLAGLQIKFILLSLGQLAIALAVGDQADATNEEHLAFVNVPYTIKLSDEFRVNINTGWSFNTQSDTSHFTWGGSLEWDFIKSWTLVAEVFGQTSIDTEPRMQAGLRYTPTKSVDIDMVYGHNIAGENAHWITAGLTVRF